MSMLDKLLEEVDVRWESLEDISEVGTGSSNRKDENENGQYPFYVRSKKILKSNTFQFDETAIIIPGEGGIGDIFHYVKGKYALHQRAYRIKIIVDNLDSKFLYYYMCDHFKMYIIAKSVGATSISIRKPMIQKFQIPIPCPDNTEKSLKIQREIVRVLDTFTELTNELTNEHTARKKQFEYYREQLLTFDKKEVKHLPMNDENIGEFIRGKRFVKTDMVSKGVPCIHYGEMYTYYGTWADKTKSFVSKELVERKKLRSAEKGDVVIVAAGETIEEIGQGTAWLGDEGVVIHDACFYYKSDLNPKYVAYFTRTRQFHDQIKKHIRTGKISAINAKGLGKAVIPIPSPEEQKRIVSILDKFDVLTTSISEGLPKEIKLRKKQYEYYRNKLLTFPKDTVEA